MHQSENKANQRLSTYRKNVMLIEQPSPAPTPLSRRIVCACRKFSAPSNARVTNVRAALRSGKGPTTFVTVRSIKMSTCINTHAFCRCAALWPTACWWRTRDRGGCSSWCSRAECRHSTTMCIALRWRCSGLAAFRWQCARTQCTSDWASPPRRLRCAREFAGGGFGMSTEIRIRLRVS